MASLDIEPLLDEVAMTATDFAVSRARGGRLGVLCLPFFEDAWGGIDADQPGLVLEAGHSLLNNGIVVYLAFRGVTVSPDQIALELLKDVAPRHFRHAWSLMTETLSAPEEVRDWVRRVMEFVEFELGVKAAVDSWSGEVTEAAYLVYRYNVTYPPILLAEHLGVLELCGVPDTYVELAHQARDASHVGLEFLSGR
jgi:hypothetical protein